MDNKLKVIIRIQATGETIGSITHGRNGRVTPYSKVAKITGGRLGSSQDAVNWLMKKAGVDYGTLITSERA